MNKRQSLLLRAIQSALELTPTADKLSAEQMNDLGNALGFDAKETLRLVEALRDEGFLELHWPQVSVTGKAESVNSGQSSGDHIVLGPGATYVGSNAQIGAGAAVGQNAMGAGAVRNEGVQPLDLTAVIGALAAVHQNLVSGQASLPAEAQQPTKQLAEETDAIRQEISKPAASRASVEQRLDRAKGILEKLGGITAVAIKLKPVFDLLHRSFDSLSGYIRSLAS